MILFIFEIILKTNKKIFNLLYIIVHDMINCTNVQLIDSR